MRVEKVRKDHAMVGFLFSNPICQKCSSQMRDVPWPCDAIQLADEVERLRDEVQINRSAISQQIEVNEELREALGEIAHFITSDEMSENHPSKHTDQLVRDRIIKKARAALILPRVHKGET